MKVRCVQVVKPYNEGCFTIGKIYEAEINPKWYDFAVQSDNNKEGTLGGGFSREGFEFVSGTPEEKALWDYCEENGIDGL